LTIHLKVITTLGVAYLNSTMWEHDFHNEWPSPSWLNFLEKRWNL